VAQKTITKNLMQIKVWTVALLFIALSSASPCRAFNIGEEREVGEKLLYSVRSTFTLLDDPDITQYVTKIGDSVLEVAGIQYFNYHFFVIEDKDFNAFAAPSGLIFFYSGLIGAMNSENEFVSVLAHEIGHIVKRHIAERVEKGKYSSVASLGLAVAALAFGGSATPALLTGALAAGQSVNLHFSRQHEEEADLLAFTWMEELQRDPEGQARMLESMRRIARYRSDKLPQYLLTHPNPEERLHTVESLIDANRERIDSLKGKTDDFEFLRFKYRVLSQVQESRSLRASLNRLLQSDDTTAINRTMAKYGLSQLERLESNYQKSLDYIDEVIDAYPDRSLLLVDKGVILMAAGMNDKAEQVLREALERDRSDMYGVYSLAKLLLITGRQDEAVQYFTEVMYELPEYAKVYYELGQIAALNKQGGISSFYLGKYNLYEGKLTMAIFNFQSAIRDKSLPADMKNESKALLEKIKKLQKS
jgi:predicted Zn-dependent protease